MIGLNAHFKQNDKAFLWAIGVFIGPLNRVEMSMAIAILKRRMPKQ